MDHLDPLRNGADVPPRPALGASPAQPDRGRAGGVHPRGETAWSKTLQYYAAILGGIWLGCFLVPLLVPFLPFPVAARLARHHRFNTFAAAFKEFSPRDWRTLRIEGLGSLVFWTAVIALGPWRLSTLLIAYSAFAFSWSSLQWIYHMHTPVHVVEGAYNLRAPLPIRALFLNFNYNLTHHRNPSLPWQELYRQSDPKETQPIWYRYLLVFRPPTPFPDDPSILEKRYF